MSMTGTAVFFIFVILQTTLGVYLSVKVLRRHRRGWLRLKAALPKADLELVAGEARVNIYLVWGLRVVQVLSELGTGLLLFWTILNPLFSIKNPWFSVLVIVWLALFYQLNPMAWNVLAATDLYLGRRKP